MSYATVWLNGQFVGGWPYGYASWRVDLTPLRQTGRRQRRSPSASTIRRNSSRWYPGGGIYRNVWLVKTAPVHVGQWGTYVTTPEVTKAEATVDLKVTVDNNSRAEARRDLAYRDLRAQRRRAQTGGVDCVSRPG